MISDIAEVLKGLRDLQPAYFVSLQIHQQSQALNSLPRPLSVAPLPLVQYR